MKPKICNFPSCIEVRLKKPGSNLFFRFCAEHQIKAVLSKIKDEAIKDKAELDKVRKTGSYKATSENSRALKLADDWFSKYIRLKHSFELNGIRQAKCYTCENIYPITVMDNGHFQKRQYMATRYHLNDCRPQCTSCNDWKKGQYEIFEERLINEIGFDEVENIKQLAKSEFHYSVEYLKEIARIYKFKFNELLKELQIKSPWK